VKSRGIQSIEVGGRLLQVLARVGEPMMLRDLAREAGMTPGPPLSGQLFAPWPCRAERYHRTL